MTNDDKPRWSARDGQVLRARTTRFIEAFPPGGRVCTISRAGLNGMAAAGLKGGAVLRGKTTRFIDVFPPGGTVRTISRAGLNGMEAIERGRRSAGESEPG